MKKRITLIIPAYNEQEVLASLVKRLDKLAGSEPTVDFEFLFVNDGSRDKTLSILQDLARNDRRISYVSLSRNFGKELAMKAGLDNADGDAVVIIDADLQDPPELIPQMIKLWRDGYDDVYARRTSRKGESWLKKFTSNQYYCVLQSTTKIPIQHNTGDFRLLDRRCVLALRELREHDRNTKALFSWIGYRKKEITYERDKRAAGKTHWNYFQLVSLAIDGITSFTTAPLRLASVLGMLVSLAAFVYIIVIVIRTLAFGIDIDGYASTMSVILFLGGVQLLSLGVIGEYIGRIFNESKNRPLYLIEEIHRGKVKKSSK
ncbi:glycosyl transferase [Alphaproteobacteria bacterium]|nr:glycosyl transferase [Alphaproteobacteria bacterium]